MSSRCEALFSPPPSNVLAREYPESRDIYYSVQSLASGSGRATGSQGTLKNICGITDG